MSINYLNQSEGIKELTQLLYNEKLVPIFGSGYTQDSDAYGGKVLNGSDTIIKMVELVKAHSTITLDDTDFNKVSERFFKLVPQDTRNDFLRKHFTQVKLSDLKKSFLSLPWHYSYTLNIDDGIERTEHFTPILPYNDVNPPNTTINLLYKLHGDAMHEIKYKTEQNIVFSVNQYINSLTSSTNRTLINSILTDYKQNNLLFIGCSFKNEPDLKFIFSQAQYELTENTTRAVLRKNRLSPEQELDLMDYGINTIILVDDYDLFYQSFINEFKKLENSNVLATYPFSNPRYTNVGNNKEKTLTYFTNKNIFNESDNTFYIPGLYILRSCLHTIEQKLLESESIIIRGRRFSGKTFLLSSLPNRYSKYTTYYFPSSNYQDEDVIRNLIKNTQNSLFLFDSNSLTDHAYLFIANAKEILVKNKNKLVIAINSNDSFLSESLTTEIIDIEPKFDYREIKLLNPLSDKYALIRRKKDMTNIDYLKYLHDEQKVKSSYFNSLPKKFSLEESAVLLLLCVKDKLYFSDITALNIKYTNISILLTKMNGIIERVPVSRGERSRHSSEKIINNSKYYLYSIIRRLDTIEIINCVNYIVSHFLKDKTRKRLYVEVVLFDTLNQLFSGKQSGAGNLIFAIYNSLENNLSQDMDYWLQRAKSIYRLKPNDENELKNAYQFAKKAYEDGKYRLKVKSSLTISLICCLLSKAVSEASEQVAYQHEAINFADKTVNSEFFTFNHINLSGELKIGKKYSYDKLIIEICDSVINSQDSQDSMEIALKAVKLKNNFLLFIKDLVK